MLPLKLKCFFRASEKALEEILRPLALPWCPDCSLQPQRGAVDLTVKLSSFTLQREEKVLLKFIEYGEVFSSVLI